MHYDFPINPLPRGYGVNPFTVSFFRRGQLRSLVTVIVAFLVATTTFIIASPSPAPAATGPSVDVSGNRLIDQNGQSLRIQGVSRSGSEYRCRDSDQVFNGPVDQNQINNMKSWGINTVRIPLNEHCWLSVLGNAQSTGAAYRAAITDYVNRLNANGMYAILDLHFTWPYDQWGGSNREQQDRKMPNDMYSLPFWSSVADTFKSNSSVMFELYNEPHDINWDCWKNGCEMEGYKAAGMQEMVDAVRDTGATNPVIINGIDWGHDMRQLLQYMPTDPAGQLVAGQHLYNFKRCADATCWDTEFKPIANAMPLVSAELGQDICAATTIERYMDWSDANGGDGYAVWAYEPGYCPGPGNYGGLGMLTDWNSGNATPWGEMVREHYTNDSPPPTTNPPTTTTTTTAPPTSTTSTTTTTAPPTTTTTTPPPTTNPPTTTTPPRPPDENDGYRLVTRNGRVYSFGGLSSLGNAPSGVDVAGIASTSSGNGYWIVATNGRVYTFGDATHHGDMAGNPLNGGIVDIAVTPDGRGYWLLGSDGGVFSYGSARFYGSTGSEPLNQPVLGMTSSADGRGYWLVAADGGIFAFGNSRFYGSTGSIRLNQPMVGMSASPDGRGYWLVAADGGIFNFGPSSRFHGSAADLRLNAPVVGMGVSNDGSGYRLVAADGGVFAYGNAPFSGSLGSTRLDSPVVSITD